MNPTVTVLIVLNHDQRRDGLPIIGHFCGIPVVDPRAMASDDWQRGFQEGLKLGASGCVKPG